MMTFPKYWARQRFSATTADGTVVFRNALGWSDSSMQEAQHLAEARAKAAVDRLLSRNPEFYDYGALPSKEPVLETHYAADQCVAVVTRNRYGAPVLNTDRVLFADIDLPTGGGLSAAGLLDTLVSFFKPKPPQPTPEEALLSSISQWQSKNPTASFRVYRTFAGLRLLFTDRQYSPTDEAVYQRLKDLKTDHLYVHLTKQQGTFRARLSPKPWRCGVATPAVISRIDHPDFEQKLQAWADDYEPKASAFATCQLVREFGSPADDAVIRKVIELHDRETIAAGKPLA